MSKALSKNLIQELVDLLKMPNLPDKFVEGMTHFLTSHELLREELVRARTLIKEMSSEIEILVDKGRGDDLKNSIIGSGNLIASIDRVLEEAK